MYKNKKIVVNLNTDCKVCMLNLKRYVKNGILHLPSDKMLTIHTDDSHTKHICVGDKSLYKYDNRSF